MKKDLLKGKVKRFLREDSEIGQIGAPALQSFVTAVECFIKEIGFKMAQHAKENGLYVLTPVELKKSLQTDPSFDFLAEKLQAIDEDDNKYQKFYQFKGKRKLNPNNVSKPSSSAKEDKSKKPKLSENTKSNSKSPKLASKAVVVKKSTTTTMTSTTQAIPTTSRVIIQEDSDYDESEEDEE